MSAAENAGGWPDPTKPGVPMQPEITRPHELWNLPHYGGLGPTFWTWDADVQYWTLGFFMKHPEEAAQAWRYIGPCLLPSEIAAREAAAAMAMKEAAAALIECGCKNRNEVVMQRPNSAARWNLCEHPNCMMIEAAAIRALPLPAAAQAALDAVRREAVMREREACLADIANERLPDQTDNDSDHAYNTALEHAVAAIRARGEAE